MCCVFVQSERKPLLGESKQRKERHKMTYLHWLQPVIPLLLLLYEATARTFFHFYTWTLNVSSCPVWQFEELADCWWECFHSSHATEPFSSDAFHYFHFNQKRNENELHSFQLLELVNDFFHIFLTIYFFIFAVQFVIFLSRLCICILVFLILLKRIVAMATGIVIHSFETSWFRNQSGLWIQPIFHINSGKVSTDGRHCIENELGVSAKFE